MRQGTGTDMMAILSNQWQQWPLSPQVHRLKKHYFIGPHCNVVSTVGHRMVALIHCAEFPSNSFLFWCCMTDNSSIIVSTDKNIPFIWQCYNIVLSIGAATEASGVKFQEQLIQELQEQNLFSTVLLYLTEKEGTYCTGASRDSDTNAFLILWCSTLFYW